MFPWCLVRVGPILGEARPAARSAVRASLGESWVCGANAPLEGSARRGTSRCFEEGGLEFGQGRSRTLAWCARAVRRGRARRSAEPGKAEIAVPAARVARGSVGGPVVRAVHRLRRVIYDHTGRALRLQRARIGRAVRRRGRLWQRRGGAAESGHAHDGRARVGERQPENQQQDEEPTAHNTGLYRPERGVATGDAFTL